jgi:hypothetical protein
MRGQRDGAPLLPVPRPAAIAVIVKVPWDSARPHAIGSILGTAIRAALRTREELHSDPPDDDGGGGSGELRVNVIAIGPSQINWLDEPSGLCTVTYPAGSTTVLSVQPDGTIQTREQGANGVYERAILYVDRLIYAPIGPAGKLFLVPYAPVTPNPE